MSNKDDAPLFTRMPLRRFDQFADAKGRSKLAEVMGAEIRRKLDDVSHTVTGGDLLRCIAYGCARNPLGVCVRCYT